MIYPFRSLHALSSLSCKFALVTMDITIAFKPKNLRRYFCKHEVLGLSDVLLLNHFNLTFLCCWWPQSTWSRHILFPEVHLTDSFVTPPHLRNLRVLVIAWLVSQWPGVFLWVPSGSINAITFYKAMSPTSWRSVWSFPFYGTCFR